MFNFLYKYKVVLVYAPLIIYWIAIFIGTSLPGSKLPPKDVGDKVVHFLAYFGLSIFFNLALIIQKKYLNFKRNHFLYSILIIAVYGAFDEIHQLIIPDRSCDILDWTADIAGALLGLCVIFLLKIINQFVFEKVK